MAPSPMTLHNVKQYSLFWYIFHSCAIESGLGLVLVTSQDWHIANACH